MLAITDSQTIVGALMIWTLLIIALYLTRKLLGEDRVWQRWRIGFFFERDPHDIDDGDEDDDDEDETPEPFSREYP